MIMIPPRFVGLLLPFTLLLLLSLPDCSHGFAPTRFALALHQRSVLGVLPVLPVLPRGPNSHPHPLSMSTPSLFSAHPQLKQSRRRSLAAILKRSIAFLFFLTSIVFFSPHAAFAGVSGGRMGGSFSRSNGVSSSPRSTGSGNRYAPARYYDYSPPIYYRPTTTALLVGPSSIKATDIVMISGISFIIYNSVVHRQNSVKATVMSLTVCLSSTGTDSVMDRLRVLSDSVDTTSRQGVLDLVGTVALELLRKESSIVSAVSSSTLFHNDNLAQQAFHNRSTLGRAKFDKETISKFGDSMIRSPDEVMMNTDNETNNTNVPTMAVVTITLSLADTSISLPSLSSRTDLIQALRTIASIGTPDNILAGEVLWAPTGINERLTMDDVYADYPDLVPL